MGGEGHDGSRKREAIQAVIVGMCWDILAVSFYRSRKCVCVCQGQRIVRG